MNICYGRVYSTYNTYNAYFSYLAHQTLEKSREIIKHLKEEKKAIEEQMESVERERDASFQELRRGKVEAVQVMSVSVGEGSII